MCATGLTAENANSPLTPTSQRPSFPQKPAYATSRAISDACTPEEKNLLIGLGNILSWGGMMLLCCRENKLPKTGLGTLCTQIAATTLQFGKPYEELDFRRLSQGKPSLFQTGTGTCARQISRDMKTLCAAGLVHRLVRSGKSNLYALDPKRLSAFIQKILAEHKADESSNARHLRSMWADKAVPYLHVLEELSQKILAFSRVTGRNSKEIIEGIRSTAAQFMAIARKTATAVEKKVTEKVDVAVNAFYESTPSAMPDTDEPTNAQCNKWRAEPLFDRKGHGNGRAGLALWERYARDYAYPDFESPVTGVLIGKMRHYLEELRTGRDRTEEEVRAHIERVLKAWNIPNGYQREFKAPSKFGGERTCTVSIVPFFDAFYNERARITSLLFAFDPVLEVENQDGEIPDCWKYEQL